MLVGLVIDAVGVLCRVPPRKAALLGFAVTVVLSFGGWGSQAPYWPLLLITSAVLLAFALRSADSDLFWIWTTACALCLGAMLVVGVLGQASYPARTLQLAAPGEQSGDRANEESVYVIILDSYPGKDPGIPGLTEAMDDLADVLDDHDLALKEGSLANYNFTFASLSSAFNLGHELDPLETSPKRLFDAIGGMNEFVESMKHAGYRHVHVESAWPGSACSSAVELCYSAPIYDDYVRGVVDLSLIGRLWHRSGVVAGGLHAIEQLKHHLGTDDGGDLVTAHILLPHPPLELTSGCEQLPKQEFNIRVLNRPGMADSQVAEIGVAFAEQTRCVNKMLAEFIDTYPSEWPIIIASDHGTDYRGQSYKAPDLWSKDDITERFSNLYAARLPCQQPFERDLVNLMRHATACLTNSTFDPVVPHFEVLTYYTYEPRLRPP